MGGIHTVRQGECLSRIAAQYGFANWKTVYEHPDNADLRRKRPNPNVLFPGDIVKIPVLRKKEEQAATGKHHRFVVKAPRKWLRIVFKTPKGEAYTNEPYVLEFGGGRSSSGKTDGTGLVNEPVAPGETTATIEIAGRVLALRLGHLNPNGDVENEDLSGIQARLNNLGYACGKNDGRYGRQTRAALAVFQAGEEIEVNGLPDEASLQKLEELHGC